MAECEYCHTRYTLESSGETPRQPQFQYTAKPPQRAETGRGTGNGIMVATAAAVLFILFGAAFVPRMLRGGSADGSVDAEQAAVGVGQTAPGAEIEGASDLADAARERLREDPLFAAFCEAVFDRPVEEVTAALRGFDPADPVRYDFSLFGAGIDGYLKEC